MLEQIATSPNINATIKKAERRNDLNASIFLFTSAI